MLMLPGSWAPLVGLELGRSVGPRSGSNTFPFQVSISPPAVKTLAPIGPQGHPLLQTVTVTTPEQTP